MRGWFLPGSLVLFTAACLGAVTACSGHDDGTATHTDAGSKRESDAGAVLRDAALDVRVGDAANPIATGCTGDLPVMKVRDLDTNIESDPDWSCYAATEQDAGARPGVDLDAGKDSSTRRVSFRVVPLPSSWFAGVTIDFFFGPSTLGAPAVTRVFDADAVTFEVPSASTTVSARIHALARDTAGLSVVEVREYGLPKPVQLCDHIPLSLTARAAARAACRQVRRTTTGRTT